MPPAKKATKKRAAKKAPAKKRKVAKRKAPAKRKSTARKTTARKATKKKATKKVAKRKAPAKRKAAKKKAAPAKKRRKAVKKKAAKKKAPAKRRKAVEEEGAGCEAGDPSDDAQAYGQEEISRISRQQVEKGPGSPRALLARPDPYRSSMRANASRGADAGAQPVGAGLVVQPACERRCVRAQGRSWMPSVDCH